VVSQCLFIAVSSLSAGFVNTVSVTAV
jgi:hypothetical protein